MSQFASRLARMQKEVEDKTSAEYQRQTWEAMRVAKRVVNDDSADMKLSRKNLYLISWSFPNACPDFNHDRGTDLAQALRKSINGLVNKVNVPWIQSWPNWCLKLGGGK